MANELSAQSTDEIAALRAELAALRTNLEILFDADLGQRPAIENQAGYADLGRHRDDIETGPGRQQPYHGGGDDDDMPKRPRTPSSTFRKSRWPPKAHRCNRWRCPTAGTAARTGGPRRPRKPEESLRSRPSRRPIPAGYGQSPGVLADGPRAQRTAGAPDPPCGIRPSRPTHRPLRLPDARAGRGGARASPGLMAHGPSHVTGARKMTSPPATRPAASPSPSCLPGWTRRVRPGPAGVGAAGTELVFL